MKRVILFSMAISSLLIIGCDKSQNSKSTQALIPEIVGTWQQSGAAKPTFRIDQSGNYYGFDMGGATWDINNEDRLRLGVYPDGHPSAYRYNRVYGNPGELVGVWKYAFPAPDKEIEEIHFRADGTYSSTIITSPDYPPQRAESYFGNYWLDGSNYSSEDFTRVVLTSNVSGDINTVISGQITHDMPYSPK